MITEEIKVDKTKIAISPEEIRASYFYRILASTLGTPRPPPPVVVGSTFVPSDLENLIWLWDVDDAATVTTAGGHVIQLDDLIGTQNLVSASAGPTFNSSDSNLGGRSSCSFVAASSEGLDNNLSTETSPVSFFMIFTIDDNDGGYPYGTAGGKLWMRLESLSTPTISIACASGFTFGSQVSNWNPSQATAYLYIFNSDGTSSTAWVDDTQLTLDASSYDVVGFNGISIGQDFGSFSNVTITMAGVCSEVMGSSDRTSLYEWSQTEAGVT